MRRAADVSTLCCPLVPRERDLVDEMKAKIGLSSDADCVRVALYRLAVHLDVRIDCAVFAVRGGWRSRRRKAS
ncbi:MAG: hypothetical protein NUW22_12345 [Acidobacteria bacterium]|nr:hypothetical protein [Acidobacteriota bacterium]